MHSTCSTSSCPRYATHAVHWPGKTEHFCTPCTIRALSLADKMGFDLTVEVIENEAPACPVTDGDTILRAYGHAGFERKLAAEYSAMSGDFIGYQIHWHNSYRATLLINGRRYLLEPKDPMRPGSIILDSNATVSVVDDSCHLTPYPIDKQTVTAVKRLLAEVK